MLSDQPITTAKDDLLGRAAFARQLASAMLKSPSCKKESFTFGLCGQWGSGKTSIINMVMEALAGKKAGNPIVVPFNPWHYPAEEQLAEQLMHTLAAELHKPVHGKRLHKAARAMVKYAAALNACPPGNKPDPGSVLLKKPPKKKKKKKKKANTQKLVSERKNAVRKRLKKQNKKIYVVMDDIDRLSSRRIRHALQLTQAVAGFPRIVYLLSFDQDVVADALSKELYGDGRDYLEKFTQVQFDIPAPEPGRIRDILMAYISAWLQTQKGLNFDRAYFDEISPFLFARVKSIRDVYRFINTFRVRYQALENEVNFVDLLAVTALQLHVPKALPWIQGRRDDLLRGGGLSYRDADPLRKKRLKEEHRRMITALDENEAGPLLQLIGHMFPRYGSNILDIHGDDTDSRFVRMRRICCEEFFDLYFTQSADGLTITQREIVKVIYEMDAPAMRAYTAGLTQEERRSAFLNHLPHYLDDVDAERLPMLFDEVLWLSRQPEGKTPAGKPFQRSFFHECINCALRILAQMQGYMPVQCLKDAAAKADKTTIPVLIALLTRIRRRTPDAEAIEIGEDVIITHLRQLMNKVHAIALKENWLLSHQPLPVLAYWKQADAVSFRVYFQRLMEDDVNAARLVSCLTQRFDQGENMEYQYGDMDGMHAFSDEFPQTEARDAVLRLRGTAAFRELPKDTRLDCVAFSLMDEGVHRVTQKDVMESYPAWMGETQET